MPIVWFEYAQGDKKMYFDLKPGKQYFVQATNGWAGEEITEYCKACGTDYKTAEDYVNSLISKLIEGGYTISRNHKIVCMTKNNQFIWIEIVQDDIPINEVYIVCMESAGNEPFVKSISLNKENAQKMIDQFCHMGNDYPAYYHIYRKPIDQKLFKHINEGECTQ